MKTHDFKKPLLAIAAASLMSFLAGNAMAQDSSASTATLPPATTQTAPQLSYGVPQIVQLSQAKAVTAPSLLTSRILATATVWMRTKSFICGSREFPMP
jgi:hypothetical protein